MEQTNLYNVVDRVTIYAVDYDIVPTQDMLADSFRIGKKSSVLKRND